MKLSDLRAGLRVRAIGDWAHCFSKGDVFEIKAAKDGALFICCRDLENGPFHDLSCQVDESGQIPEFEVAA